jgi:hypothetical protein
MAKAMSLDVGHVMRRLATDMGTTKHYPLERVEQIFAEIERGNASC